MPALHESDDKPYDTIVNCSSCGRVMWAGSTCGHGRNATPKPTAPDPATADSAREDYKKDERRRGRNGDGDAGVS